MTRATFLRLGLIVVAALAPTTAFARATSTTPPLVTDEQALEATAPVYVAVVVETGTVTPREVDGQPGVGFTARGASGRSLEVELAGKLPTGFEVAPVVVLVGSAQEGRFRADRVLLPGAAVSTPAKRGLRAVMAVSLVIWLGLFLYVFVVDRRVRRLEE